MSKKKNIKSKEKLKKSKIDINTPNTISTFKVKSFLIIILLFIIALIVRIVFLQFVDGSRLQTLASSQQTLTETLKAKRGNIYDATGQALAMSYSSDKVYFDPSDIVDDNREIIAQNLSNILELNYDELLEKMTSAKNMILIASNVEQTKANSLTDWKESFKKSQQTGISYTTDTVSLDPSKMNLSNKEIIARNVASILNLDYNELLSQISTNEKKFVVSSNVDSKKITEIRNWNNNIKETGISIEESTSRAYPSKNLASTVIGFVGSDNQGLSGIEYYWDSILSGTAGKSVSLKDASQSEIANSQKTYIAAENGYDITLTIDSNIQSIVEKHLAEAVVEYGCDSGITIGMDPSTGKILAMADYPNYDCNNPNSPNSSLAEIWDSLSDADKTTAKYAMWKPKAVTDLYEPGSIFKIITSAIALEENIIDTDTYVDYLYCNGSVKFEGAEKPVSCWKAYPYHQAQTLRFALEHSCNPAFMQLGTHIGKTLTYKYYDAFGFFGKTGISLSGEPKSGIFYDINKIKPIELAIMSFGQRFTITPLQMITAASALANDGVLLQPQIVEKITNADNGEVTTFEAKKVRQVVSKETADKVTSMMESVVTDTANGATGSKVAVNGYSIGGKTGTSEPINGSSDGYVASFLAISPVENTKIVLLVILKNPVGKLHNGGQIAAPTASKMLSEILPYMNVESGNKDNDTSNISNEDLY